MSHGSQAIESGHSDVVHDVQMDYYGRRLASCSSDRLIKIFAVNGDAHTHLADLAGHEGPVWQVAWAHPKFGNILASCSYDKKVIIWKETAENQWIQAKLFKEHDSSVNSISFAPHEFGLCLACGSSDGSISICTRINENNTDDWSIVKIPQAHPFGVTSVSWAPAEMPGSLMTNSTALVYKLASGGCDSTVKVWKMSEGKWIMDCYPALSKHSDWVRDVAWAPNLGLSKTTIASASQDGTVIIWTQAAEGEQWENLELNNFKVPVWRVSWSLTGNILAVSDGNNNVTLWKEATDGEWTQVYALS